MAGAASFFFFLISRQREPVICHAVSNCVEGAQKEARRRGGRAGVGRVMDNGEACRWTGAPPPLDNPHWSGSVNNGAARTIFRCVYGGEKECVCVNEWWSRVCFEVNKGKSLRPRLEGAAS